MRRICFIFQFCQQYLFVILEYFCPNKKSDEAINLEKPPKQEHQMLYWSSEPIWFKSIFANTGGLQSKQHTKKTNRTIVRQISQKTENNKTLLPSFVCYKWPIRIQQKNVLKTMEEKWKRKRILALKRHLQKRKQFLANCNLLMV